MIIGYCRVKTLSELTDYKHRLKADELFVDVVSDLARGSQENLQLALDKLSEGDTLVIIDLVNAFADTTIFYKTCNIVASKGVVLKSIDGRYDSSVPNNSAEFNSVINNIIEFTWVVDKNRGKTRVGARRTDYPSNFLDIFNRYIEGKLSSRKAAAECFMSHPTFLKLVKEFNK